MIEKLNKCHRLNCDPHQIRVLKANPPVPQNVTIFGDRALKKWLSYMRFLKCAPIQHDWCSYKKKLKHRERQQMCVCVQRDNLWRAGRGLMCAGWGDRSQKKPSPLVTWPWTSSLQNCEKINFSPLNHPFCGSLLWQP